MTIGERAGDDGDERDRRELNALRVATWSAVAWSTKMATTGSAKIESWLPKSLTNCPAHNKRKLRSRISDPVVIFIPLYQSSTA